MLKSLTDCVLSWVSVSNPLDLPYFGAANGAWPYSAK